MNIAFFVGSFPVLSETFILNQITGLIDQGHSVDIYAKNVLDPKTSHKDIAKYRLKCHTHPHGDAAEDMPQSFLPRAVDAAKHLCQDGFDSRVLLRSLNVAKYGADALSCRLLYRALPFLRSPNKYDIVHCHFGPNGQMASDLKSIGAFNAKIITTFHGSDISRYIQTKGENVYDSLFKTGDLFLPISERWKARLIELGCNENKIKVHRMGIDTQRFTLSNTRPNRNSPPKILTVGRLVPKKGIADGINAVAHLLNDYPDLEYSIVGDGPLRESLEELIASLGAGKKIKMLGIKTQDEIVEIMKETTIFLAPSMTDRNGNQEGVPVVLMEAMASELPVVSTRHSGIPELIQDGQSGFLVPERDTTGLREKLGILLANPELCIEMGKKGRKCVLEKFDICKLNKSLINTYETLLNS